MKKTIIKLLAGLLAVSLLAGCGKAVKTEEKSANKKSSRNLRTLKNLYRLN